MLPFERATAKHCHWAWKQFAGPFGLLSLASSLLSVPGCGRTKPPGHTKAAMARSCLDVAVLYTAIAIETNRSQHTVCPLCGQSEPNCSNSARSPLSSRARPRAHCTVCLWRARASLFFWPHYRLCTHLHQRTTKSRLMRLRVPFLETPVIEWQLTRPKSTARVSLATDSARATRERPLERRLIRQR